MDAVLQQLVEFLKTASPLVWGALIKQVYVEVFGFAVWGCVWGAVAFLLVRLGQRINKDGDDEVVAVALYGIAAVVSLLFVYFLVSAVQWSLNPEFYAIRFILEKLTGE